MEMWQLQFITNSPFPKVNQAVEDFVGMKVMLHDIQGEDKEVGTQSHTITFHHFQSMWSLHIMLYIMVVRKFNICVRLCSYIDM